MVFLAGQQDTFDILVEQAEDEIGAINMALGASYAGARSMVTTSGGGFALMAEGISLAGMIETPVIVHLAQRPGPATGLPTRTEQSDLDMVLFSGHGEFPRAVLAPGTPEEAFRLTHHAFNLAEKYQIPVFILTDQYLMDTFFDCPAFPVPERGVEEHVVPSSPGYQRYRIVPGGISPRAVPGGPGLVGVDSDEHDEGSHITEDLSLRTRMVDKRLAKLEALRGASLPPELVGPDDFSTLFVGWGSTYPMVKEALERLGRSDLAFLHFKQIYPLPRGAAAFLNAARRVVPIEGNATAQLGRLIKETYGLRIATGVLKYSGAPFSVEGLVERLGREPGRESKHA
jgi:2-oxoglutarate ferredoxin oxidoreductase subunit alpha